MVPGRQRPATSRQLACPRLTEFRQSLEIRSRSRLQSYPAFPKQNKGWARTSKPTRFSESSCSLREAVADSARARDADSEIGVAVGGNGATAYSCAGVR